MESNLGRLVTFRTEDDFEIIGMLFCNTKGIKDTIVIHVHGNFGNFYQNKFLWVMSHVYIKDSIDFMTINLSSHDGLAEGYYGRELKYVGGGIADYNSSQADIKAAIKFAYDKGYKHIILQGHSLGCDKVLQYIMKENIKIPLILLSPVDSYKVQSQWIKPEKIEHQISRLKSKLKDQKVEWGKANFDWLKPKEYGAKGDTSEWTYQIPITRNALLSILEGFAFKYLNLEHGIKFMITNPVFVFVGKRDGLQMHEESIWINFLKKVLRNIEIASNMDADHDIIGVEIKLSKEIVKWIKCLPK